MTAPKTWSECLKSVLGKLYNPDVPGALANCECTGLMRGTLDDSAGTLGKGDCLGLGVVSEGMFQLDVDLLISAIP